MGAAAAWIPGGVAVLAAAGIASVITALTALNWDFVSKGMKAFEVAIDALLKSWLDKVSGWFKSIGEAIEWLATPIQKLMDKLHEWKFISGNVGDIGWLHGDNGVFGGGTAETMAAIEKASGGDASIKAEMLGILRRKRRPLSCRGQWDELRAIPITSRRPRFTRNGV